jgi:hypothetical protein
MLLVNQSLEGRSDGRVVSVKIHDKNSRKGEVKEKIN